VHQIRFRPGFCPSPCWGSLQCSPDLQAGLRGPTSERKEGRRGEGGKGMGGEGRERRGDGPLMQIPGSASV